MLCLLPLIALNHPQGLGIAGLGIMAVVVWRLIEWKRAMLGWLALAAVVASVATVLWFPRHPAIDVLYRPQGWLNGWYGFNLFARGSPAFERSLHILGAFGGLNLIIGLWLVLRRNHVAGWLTLMPVLALSLPCFALPFAHMLVSQTHAENIVVFHRMLLAVPAGLAFICCIPDGKFISHAYALKPIRLPSRALATSGLTICGILIIVSTPSAPVLNRFYSLTTSVPSDFAMRHVVDTRLMIPRLKETPVLISTAGISLVLESTGFRNVAYPFRFTSDGGIVARAKPAEDYFVSYAEARSPAILLHQNPLHLYTPYSNIAYISGHWLGLAVALEHTAAPELADAVGRYPEVTTALVLPFTQSEIHTP